MREMERQRTMYRMYDGDADEMKEGGWGRKT